MNTPWQHRLTKIFLWFIAELALNVLGLDQLADYSEYMLSRNTIIHLASFSSLRQPNPEASRIPSQQT
jgi:hypothetical protein